MTVGDVARVISETKKIFGEFEVMVGDRGGLGKMVLAELSERYELHIEAAEKAEKRDYIELLNSDMMEGRIKILEDSELAQEMSFLVWDSHGQKEDRACANHVCDSFLYTWRYSFHNFSRALKRPPPPNSRAYWDEKMKEEREAIYDRKKRQRSVDYFQTLESQAVDDLAFEDPWQNLT